MGHNRAVTHQARRVSRADLPLTACGRSDPPDGRWLDEPVALDAPAAAGSRYPHLAALGSGAVMSWLEPGAQDDFHCGPQRCTRAPGRHRGRLQPVPTGSSTGPTSRPSFLLPTASGQRTGCSRSPATSTRTTSACRSARMAARAGRRRCRRTTTGRRPSTASCRCWHPAAGVQAAWLDGRQTTGEHEHGHGTGGAMTLRGALVQSDGRMQDNGLRTGRPRLRLLPDRRRHDERGSRRRLPGPERRRDP